MTIELPEPYTSVGSLLGNIGTFAATGFGLRRGDALYTREQMLAFRDAALEEAAKVCEEASMDLRAHDLQRIGATRCCAAIRALKSSKAITAPAKIRAAFEDDDFHGVPV